MPATTTIPITTTTTTTTGTGNAPVDQSPSALILVQEVVEHEEGGPL